MLEKGGAQRACGDANCVVRSRTQRQLHGKLQADFDPETGSHLHFSHLSVGLARTTGQERNPRERWKLTSQDVSQEATMTMNCLLGHLKMTKKKQNTPSTTVETTGLCGWHRLQKASVSGPTATFPEAQAIRRRSFICWCAANTSGGISSLPETRPSCVCVPQT